MNNHYQPIFFLYNRYWQAWVCACLLKAVVDVRVPYIEQACDPLWPTHREINLKVILP
jgi:hypothetical protein